MRTGARIAALGAALGGAAFGLVRLQRGRDGGLGRIMGCDVTRSPGDPEADYFEYVIDCYGQERGSIEVAKGSRGWTVERIEVASADRRKGYATALYEAAAQEACDRGGPLVSDNRTAKASRGFWRKQVRKGRAHVVEEHPASRGGDVIALPCPAPKSLARMGNLGGFGYAPAECEIENFPTRGDEGLKVLNLICRGHEVGTVTLSESEMDDEPVWIVEGIEIEPRFRRRRLGTKLYEAAAQAACRDGTALISNNRTSRKSEAFWKKQVRKGRAYVAGTDPAGKQIIALPCPAPKSLARLGGLPPNAELNVKEEPRRSDIIPPGFEICARQPGGHPFGCITARRADWLKKEPGPTPFEVNGVWVASGLQRRGIATKLYEAAAAEACKRGAPLQSDMERSPEADRFWRKQKRKGRAVPMKRILVDEEVNFFRLPCPAPADLSKALSGASGALGRAPIKARCEPIFTPQELKSLPPRFRQDNPKKCFFRKRGRFRAAKFRNKREPFRFLIVHPSTKRPGRCQKTEFDDRGAVGDREFATCAEAVADISPRQWRLDKVVK